MLRSLKVSTFLVIGFLAGSVAWAGIDEDASVFVDEYGKALLTILDQPAGVDRRTAFQVWLEDTFNLEALSGLALGLYQNSATEEQLDAYQEAFARYIVVIYETRFDAFTGNEFSVARARPLGDTDAVVRTNITGPDGINYVVDFRVERYEDDSFQVIDVAVEGLSMLKTQRDEFSAVIQRNGMDALIDSLNQRADEVEASYN